MTATTTLMSERKRWLKWQSSLNRLLTVHQMRCDGIYLTVDDSQIKSRRETFVVFSRFNLDMFNMHYSAELINWSTGCYTARSSSRRQANSPNTKKPYELKKKCLPKQAFQKLISKYISESVAYIRNFHT